MEIENLKQLVGDKSKDRMWMQLSKQRHNYQGMEKGSDEGASEAIGKTLKSPKRVNTWKMIQTDGIFTPWSAYQRRGLIPNCHYCGEEQCDF